MKIRSGFVSNSSSSSFCIVGIYNLNSWSDDSYRLKHHNKSLYNEFNRLLREESHYNCYTFDNDISLYGSYDGVEYVGIDCQKLFEDGKTFNEIREIFISKMKESHNINIPKEYVHIYYGETGE